MDGVSVSSYWPERTAQINAPRKHAAMTMLSGMSRKMTLIFAKRLRYEAVGGSPSLAAVASRFALVAKVRRAAQAVAPHAKATTEIELMGIRMAQTMGASRPLAAMLTPTTL